MRFDLIVASDEDGYRWVSHDIEKDFTGDGTVGFIVQAIGHAVLAKMEDSRKRAALPREEPEHQGCDTIAHRHRDKHDCFAEENEVITIHGNATYTHCGVCGFAISAG
jgi:hypothetical protein